MTEPTTPPNSFANHTIVITGASRGLGKALAIYLASLGARVALIARDERELSEVAAQIRASGGVAHAISADIADKNAIHRIAGEVGAVLGAPTILINNASTLGPTPLPLLLDTACEDLERVFSVNTIGPFRLTKLLAGQMAVRGSGLVVNISSDAAVVPYPTWGAYSASKAASDHLSRILAAELADSNVRVIAIDPGEMNTAMHAAAMPEADPGALADPIRVASWVVSAMRDQTSAPTGARVLASDYRSAV